jgi:hypothetical protein
MGFFEHMIRTKDHKHYDHHYDSHHFGHEGSYHQGQIGPAVLMRLAESIFKNKILLIALIIASLIVVTICVTVLVKLVPLVFSMFGYVEQSGVKGIFDSMLEIARSFWQGWRKG